MKMKLITSQQMYDHVYHASVYSKGIDYFT